MQHRKHVTKYARVQAFMAAISQEECECCGAVEERTFTDSWSGKILCIACIQAVANGLTNSPASEGDNLDGLLAESGREDDDF
jgi:hypothetical protein